MRRSWRSRFNQKHVERFHPLLSEGADGDDACGGDLAIGMGIRQAYERLVKAIPAAKRLGLDVADAEMEVCAECARDLLLALDIEQRDDCCGAGDERSVCSIQSDTYTHEMDRLRHALELLFLQPPPPKPKPPPAATQTNSRAHAARRNAQVSFEPTRTNANRNGSTLSNRWRFREALRVRARKGPVLFHSSISFSLFFICCTVFISFN